MKQTRRTFLKNIGRAGCAAFLLGATPSWALAAEDKPLAGTLYALGWRGNDYLESNDNGKGKKGPSLLTSLDLATGATKQTILDINNGHAAMAAGDGRILCIAQHKPVSQMVDADHKVMATYTAPEGYVQSGHGLVIKDRNLFLLPLRRKGVHSITDTGLIEIYDLTSLKKLDQVDSGGIQPHEIHFIPTNPNELAVSHYGDLSDDKAPFEMNVVDAKLTILDSKSFKPKRHYVQNEFNAIYTHMRVDAEGWAYAVLNQYIPFLKAEDLKPGEDSMTRAKEEMQRHFGLTYDFPIPPECVKRGALDVSLPMLRINTQTGEREIISVEAPQQLRSQSVGYNPVTGYAIGVYRHSKDLVLHKPGAKTEVIDKGMLGLEGACGITDIAGTSCIAVNAPAEGISVFDLKSRRIVKKFDVKLFDSTHLYHSSDIGI